MFSRAWLIDMAERSIATFVQAFAAFALAQGALSLETLEAAALAGAFSVLKAYGASFVGDQANASLLR